MPDFKMKRRNALAAGFASVLARTPSVRAGHESDADKAAQTDRDDDEADEEEDHLQFRATFLSWLEAASERLALPISANTTSSSSETILHIQGVHPALCVSLQGKSGFSMSVVWDGEFWDSLLWLDVYEEPSPDGSGWINNDLLEEYRVVQPTLEALWIADIFVRLLAWINRSLTQATHIALWGCEEKGATWAGLVRDGKLLHREELMQKNGGEPAHLLLLDGLPEQG